MPWLLVAAVAALILASAVGWGQLGTAEASASGESALEAAAAGRSIAPRREVILLVDASEAAGPAALTAARTAAEAALDELGPADLFNVIAFGSRPRALYPASWPATDASRDKAGRFLATLEAEGERSLLPAAEAALASPPEGYGPSRIVRGSGPLPRRVLLLTSRPFEDAALLESLARRQPPGVRVDPIPAVPAATQMVRSLLAEPDPLPAAAPLAAAQPTTVAAAAGVGAATGLRKVLLLAALALPLFLAALGWTVRRGLSGGPASG